MTVINWMRPSLHAVPACLCALALVAQAPAADFTGGGDGSSYLQDANWSTGFVPSGAEQANINNGSPVVLNGGPTLHSDLNVGVGEGPRCRFSRRSTGCCRF